MDWGRLKGADEGMPLLYVIKSCRPHSNSQQVYLPAIEGYIPNKMLCAIRAFLEFCYIARHDIITENTLAELQDALSRFHTYRAVFQEEGIRGTGFSLPRQHATNHYPAMIRLFGAPNGLCSSITEAKHIKAVKEPWRRSNHHKPLKQMLLTNQRLDKLAAARIDFTQRGMLERSKLNDSLTLIGLSPCFLPCCVTLTSIAELIRKRYNKGPGEAVNSEDYLEIVNDPSILAHTKLCKRICK